MATSATSALKAAPSIGSCDRTDALFALLPTNNSSAPPEVVFGFNSVNAPSITGVLHASGVPGGTGGRRPVGLRGHAV